MTKFTRRRKAMHHTQHGQTGGIPIFAGAQGCVLKPALKCKHQPRNYNDGNISKQDLVSALPKELLNTSMADDVFKTADTDQNGSITKTQLEDTVKKMMKEMQAKMAEDAHINYDQRGGAKGISSQANFNAVA